MSKKYLRKNEFRMDLNPKHSPNNERHPAYISVRFGHKYKANAITHSRTVAGFENLTLNENPNKKSQDKRQTRISPPYWQNEKLFSDEKLDNFRFSKKTRRQIKKYNKKFQ